MEYHGLSTPKALRISDQTRASPGQPSSGMQTVVGALKIIVRACPDVACCVNPKQRWILFVSVGLESSIQPDPGFYLLEIQIEPEGWLAGLLAPSMPARRNNR